MNRRLRVGATLFGAWLGFFALQAAVSRALWPGGATPFRVMVQIDVTLAVVWSVLSVGVAAWHRRVRALARNVWLLAACHVPTLMLTTVIDIAVSRASARLFVGTTSSLPFSALVVYYADFEIVCYLAVVAVAEALSIRAALAERQRFAERLETSLSRARLDYLEAQLQPHFLFNSLGAVSELAYEAPATAGRVLRQLIAIFRTALARKSDEVTLGEEIVGIEPYLDIQRIRFADWLRIDYEVDDAAVDCLLPRFILQPLVENAIRHGLSGRSAAGRIEISATVRAESLIVRVADNGVGLDRSTVSGRRGIGLANVRDRVAILYGDDERLRLTSNDNGGAIAELTIPARRRGSHSDARVTQADARLTPERETSRPPALSIPAVFRWTPVAIASIWFACGLLWTQQSVMFEVLRHRAGRSLLGIARNDMASALIWALLTPVVMAFAKRFPLRRPYAALRVLGYIAAGAATTFAHVAAWRAIVSPDVPLLSQQWQPTLGVDFVIFSILVAVSHRRVLAAWLRSREADAAALGAEVAAAQARAAKIQAIPPVLVQTLDGIAKTVRVDPTLTERQLTRLGDYLRLALECTDARGITPERERALDAAVAALRDSGAYSLDLTLSA